MHSLSRYATACFKYRKKTIMKIGGF